MSVLDKMRSGSDSTFMQLMLGAVFVSFVVMYGQNSGQTVGTTVATVNGVAITDVQYRREFSDRQRRRALDDEQRAQLSEQVKKDLIEALLVEDAAHRMGIEVSPDEVARVVAYDPMYFGKDGAFDVVEYEAALERMDVPRADFEQRLAQKLLRQKVFSMVASSVGVSDLELRESWRRDATQIEVTWVEVAPLRFHGEVDTSSELVAKFIEENPDRITAAYEAGFDSLFNMPVRVRVSLIRLPKTAEDGVAVEQEIDKLKAQIDGGADFAELAKQVSIDPSAVSGGGKPITALADFDPVSSQAIATLTPGQVVKVVGDDDVRLYRLEERLDAEVIAVDDVRTDLAKKLLREDDAPKRAAAFAERVQAAWKEQGAPPQAILDELGIVADTSGPFAPSQGLSRPGAPPRGFVGELKDAAIGTPLLKEVNSTYWIATVTARTEPDPAGFETEKAGLRASVLAARRTEFIQAWAEELVANAKIERPVARN